MGGLQTAEQGGQVKRGGPLRYQQVWENLKARAPEHQRIAQARRQTAGQLLDELLGSPQKVWLAKIRGEERFLSLDLLERLLEVCHGALPFEPRRAFEVSRVALELGRLLSAQVPEETHCRALCLGSHALRLLGDHRQADVLLMRAAFFLSDLSARGFFCRASGLLLWDQGRAEEAAALLHQASRRYRELGDASEEAVCEALLGLLYSEDGEWGRAASALLKARSGVDSVHRPWLAAQAHLALARCLAVTGREAEARALWQSVWTLYKCLPEEAIISLLWREALVAEAVGDLAEAGTLLGSVHRRYLSTGDLPEATLATLQLAGILARQGRADEAWALSAKLKEVFEGKQGFEVSWCVLQGLDKEMARGKAGSGNILYSSLYQSFRLRGVYPRPVLFV